MPRFSAGRWIAMRSMPSGSFQRPSMYRSTTNPLVPTAISATPLNQSPLDGLKATSPLKPNSTLAPSTSTKSSTPGTVICSNSSIGSSAVS